MATYNYNDARLIDSINSRADLAPPELVYSVIAVESGFNAFAQSNKDASGFMQVTPIAVQEIRNRWDARFTKVLANEKLSQREAVFIRHCKLPKPEMLNRFHPEHNIQLGMCYLSLQLEEYNNSIILALISYNGGYKQANNMIKGNPVATESINYALKVLYNLENYSRGECGEK